MYKYSYHLHKNKRRGKKKRADNFFLPWHSPKSHIFNWNFVFGVTGDQILYLIQKKEKHKDF